jgi:hypothetical protein
MSNQVEPFELGEGASICMYSDRHACTVVGVGKRHVDVQRDEAKVVKGGVHNGSAEYEYSRIPDAAVVRFSLRKNGRWIREGEPMHRGTSLSHGRSEYYDPHF